MKYPLFISRVIIVFFLTSSCNKAEDLCINQGIDMSTYLDSYNEYFTSDEFLEGMELDRQDVQAIKPRNTLIFYIDTTGCIYLNKTFGHQDISKIFTDFILNPNNNDDYAESSSKAKIIVASNPDLENMLISKGNENKLGNTKYQIEAIYLSTLSQIKNKVAFKKYRKGYKKLNDSQKLEVNNAIQPRPIFSVMYNFEELLRDQSTDD